MSDIEIINGNDIQAKMSGTITTRIEAAIARAREYQDMGRLVHVRFTFNAIIVTVAADSDPNLVNNTAMMQTYRPDKSVPGTVGPYPASLVFEAGKAAPYQIIVGKECLSVQAYQLDGDGWMEQINEDGDVRDWYGFTGDWYVKDSGSARIFRVADAEFVRCPCPSHK